MSDRRRNKKLSSLTDIAPNWYNPSVDIMPDVLEGLIMKGSILCNKCSVLMSKKTSTCPKCGRIQCHILIYWHEKAFRYYRDNNGRVYSYFSAADDLLAINREVREKTFKPELWTPGAMRERKLERSIDRWLAMKREELAAGELSYGTLHSYKSHTDNHILHPVYGLGKWDVREVGWDELEEFKNGLPRHLKIKTRREIMHTLHNFMKWALRKHKGLMPEFPTVKGNDARQLYALTVEQQLEGLAKIPTEYRDFYWFECELGLRPGENCALKIKDFDFEDKTVIIRRTFTIRKLRENDKEGHRRVHPLTERACEIAKKHAQGRFPDDFLFLYPATGKHWTVHRAGVMFKKFTQLPITHYEFTRHSYATQITEQHDLKTAQDLLRQKDMRSTQRYVHTNIKYLREAQQKRSDNVVEIKKKAKGE